VLLEVKNLKTHFFTRDAVVKAVDGISYKIDEGEIVGIVGESGCGKSMTAMSIMRLVPSPPGKIVEGEVLFESTDLLTLSENEMQRIRGNKISMVFQEPMTSLNPVLTIGRQLTESLELHLNMTSSQATKRAAELLKKVGIPDAERRLKDYPHQYSGGMRQRLMIAIAMSCNPRLIIADEPTTALDVTIQAQILELMQDVARETGTAIILITHNLGVVARYADRVIVMYAGKIIETGSAAEIFHNPKHPYTQGLLNSVPRLDSEKRDRLQAIEGLPPDLSRQIEGCAFAPRCEFASDECARRIPALAEMAPAHMAACWNAVSDRQPLPVAS
jgi:oligopeptide/dipeptide ABC transporter ATP-binding protein